MSKLPPPNLITRLDIPTSHGNLDVITSLPTSPPFQFQTNPNVEIPTILLIHGNSSSSQIFRSIFFPPPPSATSTPSPPICATHRLIAFDLPGHGNSSDAPEGPFPPYSSHYCMPAYADAALAVLNHLHIGSAIVFGHSLGGHVGIELIPRLGIRLKGLMITGTPAVPRGNMSVGFKGPPPSKNGETEENHMNAAESEHLSESEALEFAKAAAGVHFGGKFEPWFLSTVKRTDGRARKDMFNAARKGEGVDQRETVEKEKRVWIAVVNGAEEPFVELSYVDGVKYGKLWGGECVKIEELGHSPFWERWETFEGYLRRFVDDVTEECLKSGS